MYSFAELNQNVKDDIWNLPLYRTFGVERLFQLITERKLTLLEPRKWEDPYELALQDLVTGIDAQVHPNLYGLCWTTQGRSDALWRIYSPNKLGVRISTTVGRLIESIDKPLGSSINPENLYLGRVTYLPERSTTGRLFDFERHPLGLETQDFHRSIFKISDAIEDLIAEPAATPRDVAKALFIKRKAFEHEQEVRLLYVDKEQEQHLPSIGNGLKKLDLDVLKLIRGIQFDPRLSDDIYIALKTSIKAVLNNTSLRITKSTLYSVPHQKPAVRT